MFTSLKTLKESFLLYQTRIVAPKAPTPLASVGVATPAKIEPKTSTISPMGGSTVLSTSRKTFGDTFSR